MKKIQIIQGDSYALEVDFEGIIIDLIDSIHFTCNELSICKQLEKDIENNLFRLYIDKEETKEYSNGVYNYDLTIKFVDNNVKTVQYRSILVILEKNNKVVCYE